MADDVARLGIAVDSSQVIKAANALKNDLANGAKTADDRLRALTKSIDQLTREQATLDKAVAQNRKAFEEAFKAEFIKSFTAEIDKLNLKIKEMEANHTRTTGSVREFSRGIRAANILLAEMEVNMGRLSAVTAVMRLGFAGLAVAGAFGLVGLGVALENAAEKSKILENNLKSLFGSTAAGAKAFDELDASAKRLGTTADKLAPAFTSAFRAIKGEEFERTMKALEELNERGFRFQSGAAGREAAGRMADTGRISSDMKEMQTLFETMGDNAMVAKRKVREFFEDVGRGSASAQMAASTVSEDLVKLFKISGERAEPAAKEVATFFDAIKKNGLTGDIFAGIAAKSDQAARIIAQAFGVTGSDAVFTFEGALRRLEAAGERLGGGLVIQNLAKLHSEVEKLKFDPNVAQAWDELAASLQRAFGAIAKGAGFDSVAKSLTSLAESVNKFVDSGNAERLGKQLEGIVGSIKGLIESGGQNIKFLPDSVGESISALQKIYDLYVQIKSVTPNSLIRKGIDAIGDSLKGGESTDKLKGDAGQDQLSNDGEINASAAALQTAIATVSAAFTSLSNDISGTTPTINDLQNSFSSAGSGASQLSAEMAGVGPAMFAAASAVSSAMAAIRAASASGGDYQGQDIQIPMDIGENASGGIYMARGGGGADSLSLRGKVSPGEIIAILPPGQADASLLEAIQSTISGSPISVGAGGSTATSISTIAAPNSYNKSQQIASAVKTAEGGTRSGITNEQLQAAIAQIAAMKTASGNSVASSPVEASRAAIPSGTGQDQFFYVGHGVGYIRHADGTVSIAGLGGGPGKSGGGSGGRGSGGGGQGSLGGGPKDGYGDDGFLPEPGQTRSRAAQQQPRIVEDHFPKAPVLGPTKWTFRPNPFTNMQSKDPYGDFQGTGRYLDAPGGSNMLDFGEDWISPMYSDPYGDFGGGSQDAYDDYFNRYGENYSGNGDFGDFYNATGYDGYGGGSSYDNPYSSYDSNQYYSGSSDSYGSDYYGGDYAQGGGFTVPGSGASDSVRVTMGLTPGEMVSITPPGPRLHGFGGPAGNSGIASSNGSAPIASPFPGDGRGPNPQWGQPPGWNGNSQGNGPNGIDPSIFMPVNWKGPKSSAALPSVDIGGGAKALSPSRGGDGEVTVNFYGVDRPADFEMSRAAIRRAVSQGTA